MLSWPIENRVSYIPVVFVRARRTSDSVGMKSRWPIRCASSKKLQRRTAGLAAGPRRSGGQIDRLWGRVHQIKLVLMFHDFGNARILPQRHHSGRQLGVEGKGRVRIDVEIQDEFGVRLHKDAQLAARDRGCTRQTLLAASSGSMLNCRSAWTRARAQSTKFLYIVRRYMASSSRV